MCVGVVKQYKGENVFFYQTDEGYFVEQKQKPKIGGLKNLSPAKSNRVWIFDEFYDFYDTTKVDKVYNSIDEALIDLTGHDREWYKANWVHQTDMWGQDMYVAPYRIVEYRINELGDSYPHSVSDGSIYIDSNGVVSTYGYGGFDEKGNWSSDRRVFYRFDY